MRENSGRGCSRRERLEVLVTALTAAQLGLLGPILQAAGRLGWLGPVIVTPVSLWLCSLWGVLGGRELGLGLERAFGSIAGKAAQGFYLIWGLILLAHSARRYSDRLLSIYEGETVRALFLTLALVLALWLGRGDGGAFARTGRIFFLAVSVTVGFVLVFSLPGMDWKNLWPPEGGDWRGLPKGAGVTLSLAGYGVYTLCLPRREEGKTKAWPWVLWSSGIFAAVLLVITGTFGPALVGQLREPILYLLEGVGVPGAFRRGEAGLVAVLVLADLVLLSLLTWGCIALWRRIMPWWSWGGAVAAAGAFFVAEMGWEVAEEFLLLGNLTAGILLPAMAMVWEKIRRPGKRDSIFSTEKDSKKADIAAKWKEKKSGGENEKKC